MPTFSAKGDQEIVAFWSSFEGGVQSFEIKGQEFDLSSSGSFYLNQLIPSSTAQVSIN